MRLKNSNDILIPRITCIERWLIMITPRFQIGIAPESPRQADTKFDLKQRCLSVVLFRLDFETSFGLGSWRFGPRRKCGGCLRSDWLNQGSRIGCRAVDGGWNLARL